MVADEGARRGVAGVMEAVLALTADERANKYCTKDAYLPALPRTTA
jgi:hypothetical protein